MWWHTDCQDRTCQNCPRLAVPVASALAVGEGTCYASEVAAEFLAVLDCTSCPLFPVDCADQTIRNGTQIFQNVTLDAATGLVVEGSASVSVVGTLQAAGNLTIRVSSGATVLSNIVQYTALEGQFEQVLLQSSDGPSCEVLTAVPQYSSASLSLAVQRDTSQCGLSQGAIIGIACGCAGVGALAIVALALAVRHKKQTFTRQANEELRKQHLEDVRKGRG